MQYSEVNLEKWCVKMNAPQSYVQEQGIGANLSEEIGDLEAHLSSIATYISTQELHLPHLIDLKAKIDSFPVDKEHSKRVAVLLAISKHEADIRASLNAENIANLNLIIGRLSQLFNAFKACNTFIFPKVRLNTTIRNRQ